MEPPVNEHHEMHPTDKAQRREGIRYGREHAKEFVEEHMEKMITLISTYPDNQAEVQLQILREKFWAQDWVPKELRKK